MSEHTKEPWFLPADGDIGMIYGSNAERICRAIDKPTKANIRRIVACVNACAGIPTDMIESVGRGAILTLGHTRLTTEIDSIKQQLAEALAIIKKSACDGANCHSCANPCDKYLKELR